MKYPNCIICFNVIEDDGVRGKRYCNHCTTLKRLHAGKADHIVDNLYLGDMPSAAEFLGRRICVHELVPTYDGDYYHIPILNQRPVSGIDRTGAVVSMRALENACDAISCTLFDNKPLLVHCYGGVERSPLTLAWWLVKHRKMFKDLPAAYAFLKSKRPIVSDRTAWLPMTGQT